ncbi:hypothetical protein H4R33_000171 [Dimargaris cristalligena]|uniref:Uncharacterized protein n=1 Tax=Dimargaris cristalligena TaxID=215637 RepID=A0A4Q0A2A2_9FUNG|nr:hypothetical protein H4R33_000171 [Dimargaris cristalligena]RKP40235.1 hypothetical protein BJ085DRAFT_37446 [Dimargaris cristalligena]|eukprot:RKP40235.1 hypothetical protein BJ085DRAFT_37446 [Dimargaris cristalligena]
MKANYVALMAMAMASTYTVPASGSPTLQDYYGPIPAGSDSPLTAEDTSRSTGVFSSAKNTAKNIASSIIGKGKESVPQANLPEYCEILFNPDNEGITAKLSAVVQKPHEMLGSGKFKDGTLRETVSTLKEVLEDAMEDDSHKMLTKDPVVSSDTIVTFALVPTENSAYPIRMESNEQISMIKAFGDGFKGNEIRYLSLDRNNPNNTPILDVINTCYLNAPGSSKAALQQDTYNMDPYYSTAGLGDQLQSDNFGLGSNQAGLQQNTYGSDSSYAATDLHDESQFGYPRSGSDYYSLEPQVETTGTYSGRSSDESFENTSFAPEDSQQPGYYGSGNTGNRY